MERRQELGLDAFQLRANPLFIFVGKAHQLDYRPGRRDLQA